MAYDLQEQEQLDLIKSWWKQNGTIVSALVAAGVLAYAGWVGWTGYQNNKAIDASKLYDEFQVQLQAKDNEKIQVSAAALRERFSSTAYASMAALALAKNAFEAGDLKSAKSQLNFVLEGTAKPEIKVVAKLRLAMIALDEKAYEEGLKLLSGEFPSEFTGEVADRKADFYVAQNKLTEARTEYANALKLMGDSNPGRQLVQIKLDALGGPLPVKEVANADKK
jgi:predicted negative regulator of RcsB-dependent stress response